MIIFLALLSFAVSEYLCKKELNKYNFINYIILGLVLNLSLIFPSVNPIDYKFYDKDIVYLMIPLTIVFSLFSIHESQSGTNDITFKRYSFLLVCVAALSISYLSVGLILASLIFEIYRRSARESFLIKRAYSLFKLLTGSLMAAFMASVVLSGCGAVNHVMYKTCQTLKILKQAKGSLSLKMSLFLIALIIRLLKT